MSSASEAVKGLAAALLLLETESAIRSPGDLDEAVRICQRLRPVFSRLAGTTGFVSFLSRAIALARADAPSVDVQVGSDGSLRRMPPSVPPAQPIQPDAGLVLVSHLLGLLVTFVGESMTLSLVRDAWPGHAFDLQGSSRGVKS